jgi:pyruvate oxidase
MATGAGRARVDEQERTWYKVLERDELPEGRVKTASCAHRTLCMTHHEGK